MWGLAVYVFYRSVRLGPGSIRQHMSWAMAMTEKVNQICECKFQLWTPVFSPGIGTLVWTTEVEDLGVLEASEAKLMADDGYHTLLDQGAGYSSGDAVADGLLQVVHGSTPADARPEYSSVVTAAIAPGSFARGLEVGVQIAQRAEQITGIPTLFTAGATGQYGGVAWMADYESIAQVQHAQEALASDPSFAAFLDTEARDAFLPGALTTTTIYRRIV
jgi:hypothetical protein